MRAARRVTRTTRCGSSSPTAYDAAAAALATWRDDGRARRRHRADVLDLPHGLHRRRRRARSAPPACSARSRLDGDGSGVLPHERTLPKAKTDRLELLRADPRQPRPDLGPLARRRALVARCTRATPSPTPPRSTRRASTHSLRIVDDPDRRRDDLPTRSAPSSSCWPTATTASRPPSPTGANERAAGIDDPGADAIMTLSWSSPPTSSACGHPPAAHRRGRRSGRCATRSGGPSSMHAAGPNTPEGVAALRPRCATSGGLGLVDARRARAARARPPSSTLAPTRLPAASCATSTSARFDAGVLPRCPT